MNLKSVFKDKLFVSLFGLFVISSLFTVFFLKPQPKDLRLIKWSQSEDYSYIFSNFLKRLYPVFDEAKGIEVIGLDKINFSDVEFSELIRNQLQIENSLIPPSNPSVSVIEFSSLKPNENFKIFISYQKFSNKESIPINSLPDPKSLTKILKKFESGLFYSAYKKDSAGYYIDFIQLQSSL